MDYGNYLNNLRYKYIKQYDTTVLLPPIKSDCTCLGKYNEFSMLNSPPYYCVSCNNKGYIETLVYEVVPCAKVDYASEAAMGINSLEESKAGDFNYQKYVLHASISDSTTSHYFNDNCFKYSKEVIIDDEHFEILSIDFSSLFYQVRVIISKKN